MIHPRLRRILFTLLLLAGLSGCNLPGWQNIPGISGPNSEAATPLPSNGPAATETPAPPETLVHFEVQAPPGLSSDATIYLTLLDEITGLAMNARPVPMERMETDDQPDAPAVYWVDLSFAIGSVVKYRYERQEGEEIQVAEHLADGSPVRYRIYYVTGQGSVSDVISRWTDTPYDLPIGRIQGQATDADTGQPIPNLLIAAGGAQTVSASDGSFMLQGLPPGVHNLVGYAMDGTYQTFQQGARVADGSTTPTPIKLKKATFSNVIFVVTAPEGTPPVVPLRLAGNLTQLGNTFANLDGGMSSLAANMPVLSTLPDGRYTITATLPAGADIEYKYTLGDGFWNAEHTKTGAFRLRQLIVPDTTVLIEDTIEAWSAAGGDQTITFDLNVPKDTPQTDSVSIAFNPLFGWTPPIPMWKLGENHWAYALYGPLNLPGDFSYRYCRNDQCGVADDEQTPGPAGTGRTVKISGQPQTLNDQVSAWKDWASGTTAELPAVENVTGRGDGYRTGFELSTAYQPTGVSPLGYQPAWDSRMPQALKQIQASNANLVVFTPTWSYGRNAPGNELPILAPLPGRDPGWDKTAAWVEQAKSLGLSVAIHPAANFAIPADDWWLSAPRDESWWQVWFEQYREFALNYADLAQASGAQTLILGGEWLRPALPGQTLPDGSPSGAPDDVETRWVDLLTEVRAHFSGQLAWSISYKDVALPPAFLDVMDRIYLEMPVPPGLSIDEMLGEGLGAWLDGSAANFQNTAGKPLVLSVSCPSDPDMQTQVDCYQALLTAADSRDWISGFVSMGYYPAAALKDLSSSVNGKPASELLGLWFKEMVK